MMGVMQRLSEKNTAVSQTFLPVPGFWPSCTPSWPKRNNNEREDWGDLAVWLRDIIGIEQDFVNLGMSSLLVAGL